MEPEEGNDDAMGEFGLTVARADDGNGLVVTDVESGSAAAERDIRPGDLILAVNSIEVTSTKDVTRAIEEATAAGRNAVLVQISRERSQHVRGTSRLARLSQAGGPRLTISGRRSGKGRRPDRFQAVDCPTVPLSPIRCT